MDEMTIDTVTDAELQTLTVADEDASVEEFLADCYRNEQAVTEAELEAMARQVREEIAASPFADLTAERHAEIMDAFPERAREWEPTILYSAACAKPFIAELRRGTENGPDRIPLGDFLTSEAAMLTCVAFAHEMVIADGLNDEAWCAEIRQKIVYARR